MAHGFIDMHAHSDLQILLQPDHLAKISQGVTTELLGQDGLSYAPVDDDALAMLRKKIAGWNTDPADFDFSWRTVGEYLDRLDGGIAGNAAYLVPHGVVRALVCGWEDVPASTDDIVAMQEIVRAAMAEGAVGLSAGLTYTPGMYADNTELLALCATVGELGGFFAPHHRSYGKGALDAYAEMIDLTTRAGCPLHLSHATMNFAPNKGRAGELLAILDAAIADGADITLDTYPYLPGATMLSALLPSWSSAGGPDATLARLRDPAALARIRDDLEVHGSDGCHGVVAEWDTIEISGVTDAELDGVVGRTIVQIAADTGREPFAAFVDVPPARRAGHRDPAARRARGERAGDHAPPAAHGRERRPAGRRQAAPTRLGHLPALYRPLLPRPGCVLARGVRRAPHRARRRAPAVA